MAKEAVDTAREKEGRGESSSSRVRRKRWIYSTPKWESPRANGQEVKRKGG